MFDINCFITLLLLKKEAFNDSYSLTKVLAWKFKIISVSEVIQKLECDGLVIRTMNNGISKYEVTKAGIEYIVLHTILNKNLLLEKYIEEKGFLDSLFK